MSNQEQATVNVYLAELLDYGAKYEYFTDLLQEKVAHKLGFDGSEVLVNGFGFAYVVSMGEVALTVEYELDLFDGDDDVVYTLTPKGKLVTDLLREGLDYETASRIAGAAFPDNGEVVGS